MYRSKQKAGLGIRSFAHFLQDKWATVSESLRSLRGNERMSNSFKKCWQKNLKSTFLVCFIYGFLYKKWANRSFPLFWWAMWVNRSGRSPKMSDREGLAQVAHQKWVTMSDLLTSLRGNEQSWANRSGRSPKMSEWVNCSFFWANCSFTHFWAKNERFARKTYEWIPSPAKKWPKCTKSLFVKLLTRQLF